MAPGRVSRGNPGFSSSAPCHQWMHGRCRYGSNCKFSHDRGARGGRPQNGHPGGSGSSSQAPGPDREKVYSWRRLRPMPAFAQDAETARFFRLALDLVEEDVSLAQEVIRDLATERRLSLIKDVLEGLSLTVTPSLAAHLWESRISSFFQIILHPVIVDSVVLELELATIYRSLLGVDTARLKRLYNFVFHIVDHWTELPFQSADASAIEALSLGCGVLAKVIDTSSANIVNAHFVSIVEKIQLRLDVFGDQEAAFYSVQASKYLEYVRRRLGIGHSLPDASISTQSAPVAEFVLSQDLPGTLSRRGRRHDNDHAQIADIKLMPTLNEIMSFRDEYLPTINPSQHHLKGLPGLLDRHFRLLREDTLHDLRNAIRTRVESTDRVREVRTKIVVYDYATAVEVTFDKRSGLEFIVKIDQPKAARALDKLERAAWWVQTKRLTDGTLVCIVDDMGDIFFFQVSRSTVRTLDDSNQRDQTSGERDGPRYSLSDDKRHAFVYLKLVDASIAEVRRSLLWFKNMGSRQHRQLFEFPSILLPAFAPPLKALQSMSEKLDLPFRHLLTLHGTDRPPVIDPPLYSKRPGFSFDLSSLSNDGSNLSYTPGNPIDPAGLSRHTTLDLTQSEAILNSLSRSFALIQGPPGTGKSYTGEALIKVLLANKSKAKLGPVMCVCYTNHALDQLLEHLIDADVQNIVRIGSRSKSERLEPVNLRKVAEGMTRTKTEGKAMYDSIEALESESSYVGQRLSTYKYLNTNEKIRALLSAQYKSLHDELFGSEQQDDGWETVRHGRRRAMETWLRGGTTNNTPSRPLDQLYYTRLSDMTHKERTILHQDWLRQALAPELERLSAAHETYEKTRERNNRIRSSIDLRCLQQANIIGVTTTGLATNLDLLRRVNGKVLLCEEAGEVLEAHLLTALLPTIEHAILIGDHLQLRPQIQDWRLQRANPAGVKYSLDVSLFERLVHPTIPNTPTLPFSILDTQRRMHPSISELIRSALYPSLADSDTVQDYPAVCGITKRLFWLHHESPESGRKSDQDSIETSYSNDFEVDMVAALVSHLLRQGVYKAGEIAVLTPYLGQLNKLRSKLGSTMQIVINDRDMDDLADLESADTPSQGNPKKEAAKSSALQGVRAATVDNFQGEEANVVIVSLVRSNNEKRCGFLSTSNRINVLLSRARHGMYIIGNSHTSSHVPMWAQAIDILQRDNNFGTELELQCPRHSDNRSMVSHPEHFVQFAPDGGCHLRCDRRLNCGHACTGPCHSNFLHNAVKCLEDCARPKEHCDHPCRKRCGDACDRLCMEVVHDAGLRLPCGHVINTVECWKLKDPAAIKCAVQVDQVVPGCKHTVRVSCHVDVAAATYLCKADCGFLRPCGHACKKRCWDCRTRTDGKVSKEDHGVCRQICDRNYTTCSHRCRETCHEGKDCPPCASPCQNKCMHSKCSKKCHEPCPPCAEETCSSCCPHSKCSMPCAAPCDWVPCTKRCTKLLGCSHQCPSVCGELCPDDRYCQQCATDEIKSTVVDLIMMSDYGSIDLNEEPCIFPDCGHFLTYSTMDGQMRLQDFYEISPEGFPTAVRGDSRPFDLSEKISVCPNCRGPLRNISRYGRIVRRGLLDESTKKFISWSNTEWQKLSEIFFNGQKALQELDKETFVFPVQPPGTYDLQGARHEQLNHLFKVTGASRHKNMAKVLRQIENFLGKVKREEQPYQRVAHLVWHVNKRRHKEAGGFSFDESAIQMGSYLQAMALLLRCELLVISDYLSLCRSPTDGVVKSAKVDVRTYLNDCEKLIQTARTRNYVRQEVEGHIFIGMFCSFVTPSSEPKPIETEKPATDTAEDKPTTPNKQTQHEEMKKLGLEHLEIAKELMGKHESTAVLKGECDTAWRMLHDGVFYSEVSQDEMRAVYQAMSREFLGTGHWYTCRNGHPFTIGECGMAMQAARCPECGAPVGGQNHQSAEGVRHAREIEQLGTGIAGMRL